MRSQLLFIQQLPRMDCGRDEPLEDTVPGSQCEPVLRFRTYCDARNNIFQHRLHVFDGLALVRQPVEKCLEGSFLPLEGGLAGCEGSRVPAGGLVEREVVVLHLGVYIEDWRQ